MNKSIIAAVVIVVLGAGIWWFGANRSAVAPVGDENINTENNATTSGSGQEVVATTSAPAGDEDQAAKVTVDVKNNGFSFSPKEIKVKQGQVVTLNFLNTGGMHDLVIDELAVKTPIIQVGATASATFVATKTGTFTYYCSVGNHRAQGMEGTLIVE